MPSRPTFTFIPPALPSPAERPPIGGGWIHEIKHDGFRIVAREVGGLGELLSHPALPADRREAPYC